MAEYIEREALENALNERVFALRRMYGDHDAFADGYDDCVGRVEEFPNAADVVEVVRCRDCKFCGVMSNKKDCISWLNCKLFLADIDEDDFCSYGERKGGE